MPDDRDPAGDDVPGPGLVQTNSVTNRRAQPAPPALRQSGSGARLRPAAHTSRTRARATAVKLGKATTPKLFV